MISPVILALLAGTSGLQSTAAQPQEPGAIVVTGERIRDLRTRLEACIARHCPPNQDVDATLALAEGHFLNGDYEDSEDVIRASLDRNQRYARQYPEPVADLYRSEARVQSHRGRDPQAVRSTRNILATLREAIPQEDYRHFTARLEIAEALTRTGRVNAARDELRELIGKARESGRADVARLAHMKLLGLDYIVDPAERGLAFRELRSLAASTDSDRMFERVSARLFLARIYRERGDIARSDAMLTGIPRGDSDRRRLLYAPAYRLTEAENWSSSEADASPTRRLPDNYRDKWIDVGYWIEPNGHVSGLEILRQGASTQWAEPVLESIRGRIYEASTDSTPSYRLERYTYTAPFDVVTGSRLPQRSRRARVEFLDLTTPNEPGRAPETGVAPGRQG